MPSQCLGCGRVCTAERCVRCQRYFSKHGFERAGVGERHYGWKGNGATSTTKRERAQRMYPLEDCEKCGKKAVDRHHINGDTGDNRRENIMLLCRRCHMAEDGRLYNLFVGPKLPRHLLAKERKRLEKMGLRKQPEPCSRCSKDYKPLRRGLCHACDMYKRRTGIDRPLVKVPSIPDDCTHCATPKSVYAKGLCRNCYSYKQRTGRDRKVNAESE